MKMIKIVYYEKKITFLSDIHNKIIPVYLLI